MEEGYLEELDSNHQEIKALGNGYYDSLSKTSEQLNEDFNNTEIQESKDLKNSGNNENNNNNNVNVNPLNNESKENGYIYGLKSSLHLESHKTTKDGIDWTAEFLDLMIKLEKYSELNLELTYQQLARLANNFLDVAKSYGKIIINEASLPDSQKTIKPIKVGGLAGGPKYRVQNILFSK